MQVLIQDLNLKLAIIHALRKKGILPAFDKAEFWENTFGERYDMYADYNYESVPEIIAYYQEFEIPKRLCEKVEVLTWIELEICYDICDQWDGEDNQFEIASLNGIEHCANLEVLDVQIGLDPFDWEEDLQRTFVSLKPLLALKKLREVKLDGYFTDLEVLLKLPSLEVVEIHEYANVLEEIDKESFTEKLKANGVEVYF